MTPPPAEICTRRLVLRRWRPEDIEPFARLSGDPHVMRFFDRPRTRAECEASMERIDATFDTAGFSAWALELPGEAAFIGYAGCWPVRDELPFTPAVEAAWRLDAPFWGRGLAPEAAHAAIADVFARTDLAEIVSITAVANRPSRRVMEKLGMTRDLAGDFDHPRVPEGNPMRRHVLYRLPRETFAAPAA
jgi:ribosomal-protein-alanine N-acetyltransferase